MTDEMKKDLDYAGLSATLKEILNLEASPVAVKFAKSPEGIPQGIPAIDEVTRHCQMVAKAGSCFQCNKNNRQQDKALD